MKANLGEARRVVFFDFDGVEPVFHFWRAEQRNGRDPDLTICGYATFNLRMRRGVGTELPTVHARRFGRPCKRCFR